MLTINECTIGAQRAAHADTKCSLPAQLKQAKRACN